jgi:hypothetical protein
MIPSPDNLLIVQFTATAMMTGVIWFVQVVHYPLFAKIPADGFTCYERSHTVRTGWVVAPLMILELATASALPLLGASVAFTPSYLASLGCLILIWVSTFLIQVPLHGILEKQPDADAMRHLVTTNWIRTLLWSVRLGLLVPFLRPLINR